VRHLLAEVPAIKRFAESRASPDEELQELRRRPPEARSSGSSAPPILLSFKPRTWSFPIVGSVPYLGGSTATTRRISAADLREQGYDVDLRGASAYSTLGGSRSDPLDDARER